MIQRLNSALFGLLVVGSMVGCGGDSDKTQKTPISSKPIAIQAEINPAFLAWEKRQSNEGELKKSNGEQKYTTGYIPPMYKPTVHNPKHKRLSKASAIDSKFDLRDENLDGNFSDSKLTAVKSQGTCGACWAFASIGALEGNVKIEENLTTDFSENHLKHNHGLELSPCSGGNMDIASAYLSRANGPVNESDDPYVEDSTESNSSAVPVRYIENIVKLPVRSSTSDNDYLKTALTEHGPLYVDIHIYGMDNATADNNYSVYNSDENAISDHAVLLVGWDNNYTAQGQTGAFIVKNSWGEDWGENGYFYVPYTDTTFAFGEVAYFNDTPDTETTSFDIVHDTAPNGAVTGIAYSSDGEPIPLYGLSIYPITENQTVKSIGIHNKGDDTNISIRLFKSISFDDDGEVITSQPTDTETFSHIAKGWNTLELQTPIELNNSIGQFAVQIIIDENNGNSSYLPLDGNYTFSDGTAYSRLNTQPNQSFISTNGTNWNDLDESSNSVAIKVFAKSTSSTEENNRSVELLNLIGEDANGSSSDNNFTANDYNEIDGVTGAVSENENAYQEYINNHPEEFTSPATADEVQAMIDTVNGENNSSTQPLNLLGTALFDFNETTSIIELVWDKNITYNNEGDSLLNGIVFKGLSPYDINRTFESDNHTKMNLFFNKIEIGTSTGDNNLSIIAHNFRRDDGEENNDTNVSVVDFSSPVGIDINISNTQEGKLQDNDKIILEFSEPLHRDSLIIVKNAVDALLNPNNDINVTVEYSTSMNKLDIFFRNANATVDIDITTARDLNLSGIIDNTNDNGYGSNGNPTDIYFVIQQGTENGDSGYQQELNEIQNELDNNSSISQEFRDRKQALIDELQALLDADPIDETAIQDKFDELVNLEDTPPVDDTHVDVNLSQSQIVELFGLEFNATNAVAKIEDESGKLKITGYNRSDDDSNVENIDINLSAKEFNTTLAFTPEADLDNYWPNSIQFQVSIWEDNDYHESNMQIYTDGISISTDEQRYNDFNMSDFNLSELHNYGIKITDDNRTLFIVDGIQIFEANLSVTTPINQIRTGIRFIGKGVASIESFDYSNWFTAPLNSNDLEFINMVNEDIEGIIARLEEFTIPTDLNNSINRLVEEIQTLLGNNPLDFDLINSKKNDLNDYESIVRYMKELDTIRDSINNTANLSQDLNNTLQSLINDIDSQLTLPLNEDVINDIFDQLHAVDFSFITEKEQEILEIKEAITTSSNFSDETNSSMNTLIDDINGLLNQNPLPYDEINNKLEELRNLERSLNEDGDSQSDDNDESDSNIHGDNATIISGVITLSEEMNLTDEADCFDEADNGKPLPSCNAIFIDLFDINNEFLGSAMVHPDGNYTIYFKEIDDTFPVNMKIHTKINGLEENFYRDFGTDHSISEDDSFKSEKDLIWHEDSTGKWVSDVNYLDIQAPQTTLDLDLTAKDSDKYIVSGTVQVPDDFTPGEIMDENGDWKGWNMVSLTAINTLTGKHYWTEIGQTETVSGNHTYPFSFKLPNTQENYIIRIEKMTDKNWLEMYLDDEKDEATVTSDHNFNGNEALVSAIGIDWKENENNIWIPDTNKTGYFTIDNSVDNIAIDITSYGTDFKKIEGRVTPPNDFDLSDDSNHIYIEVIDATTGSWLGNVAVNSDGSYSILLGNETRENGYIIKANIEHWNQSNWQDSYWKNLYLDFTPNTATYTIKNESEVRWEEKVDETTGYSYWVPNVNSLQINATALTTTLDINLVNTPETYEVSGTIIGLPSNAKWVNIYLYDPISYIGKSAEFNSEDNSFIIKGLTEGKYIMNINYSDENNRYVDYLVVDNDGDFSSGTTVKDSMDTKWVPFDSEGHIISESIINSFFGFNWDTVAYWAPEETDGEKTLLNLTSDVEIGEISIPQPIPPSSLVISLSNQNLDAGKYVNFNLFVPNEPIGRWESNTSTADGVTIKISDLKAKDNYQLQVWIDGVEYWYNGTETLSSDINETNFAINEGEEKELLNLVVPSDKSTIKATLSLGNENANKTFNVYMWQTVSPYNNTWEQFTTDESGNIDVTLSVKKGSKYIMEIYDTQTWNGFVVNSQNSLILAQNSWEIDNGIWKPKDSVLIDISDNLDLGTLTPPELKTVTFRVANLATNLEGNITENVWISLESATSWYGAGNGNWSDWENPTFSDTISIKVPSSASDYYIYIYTTEHESGFIDADGNGNGDDSMTTDIDFSSNGSAKVTWNSNNADTLAISDNTNISLTLKPTNEYNSITGLVTLGADDIEAGWICATSQTDNKGNCGNVEDNGTYTIGGLSPTADEVYTIEYQANRGDRFNTTVTWGNPPVDLVNIDMDIASVTLIDINGTVTDNDIASTPVEVVLLDVNGTKWKVLDTHALTIDTVDTPVDFSFTRLAPEIEGHHYEIAVASKEMNATTGVTVYTVKDAIQRDLSTTSTNIVSDDTITITIN